MDVNDAQQFGKHLDLYAKAVAKKDWVSAKSNLEDAIEVNPFPEFYQDLSRRLIRVEAAEKAWAEAQKPIGFFARMFGYKRPTIVAID